MMRVSNYPTPTEDDKVQARALLTSRRRSAISILPDAEPSAPDAPYPSSYLGGLPFLPEGAAWPTLESGEMNFIGQISLYDLPRVPDSPLPSLGRLLFFTRTDFDDAPGPRDFAVLFDPSAAGGAPAQPPATLRPLGGSERHQRFPGMHPGVELRYGVRFAAMDSYPNWHDIPSFPKYKRLHVLGGKVTDITDEAFVLTEGEIVVAMVDEGVSGVEMAFHDVLDELQDAAGEAAWPGERIGSANRMLGYGINIQSEAETHEENILLLQLYGEPFWNGWLTDGALNFWISPDDLRDRAFARVVMTGEWT